MKVDLHSKAQKYFDRMNDPYKTEIEDAINGLKQNPPKGNIKPLRGRKDFRLTVGGYRIIFENRRTYLFVTDITPRGDAYKGGRHG
jgi:mRNA interferase RelE/StbE